jgi:hypothetical protein
MKLWMISAAGRTPLTGDQPHARQHDTEVQRQTSLLGEIQTRDLSDQAEKSLRLRQRGHWDRLQFSVPVLNKCSHKNVLLAYFGFL